MDKLNLLEIQDYLKDQNIDGWLIFDFRGQNKIATTFFNMDGDTILTRRWFYFIPKKGEVVLLVHKIERTNFPSPPLQTHLYVSWEQLKNKLKEMLKGCRKIAMEYSPQGAIPYVSCVDGGTLEMIRSLGVEVLTSANLVQYFQSRWSEEQLQSHIRAAKQADRIKDEAFKLITNRIKDNQSLNEYDVQKFILESFDKVNMLADEPPIVAVNANASNPHYSPSAGRFSAIKKEDLVLIDLSSKEKTPSAIFADITWMGFVGKTVPPKQREVFEIVARARDAGLQMLNEAAAKKQTLQGWEVDARVRGVIEQAGYGDDFYHRTGHSLDTNLHGNGVNIDSLETRDQREIVPGLGFTIEPGIYLDEFGVRSEINVYYSEEGPKVFGPIQKEILPLI
jgi:Xaa-Pro aminopeptidase